MTKKEARAILRLRNTVQQALAKCLDSLTTDAERAYAEAYWMASIHQSLDGYSYGSAPINRALDIIGD